MIKNHHEGYIGWAEYERKQEHLGLNNYGRTGPAHFAVDDVVERKASLQHLVKVEAIHADDGSRQARSPNPTMESETPMH
jgi:hypothetical protein